MKRDDATDAHLARELVSRSRTATLATLASRDDGPHYPFGSLVATAPDDRGRPLLLLSSLAEHTKNLTACPRASLLFADHAIANPLANARVTLLGDLRRAKDDELDTVRTAYLARHPEAAAWACFKDFAFYRLEISEVRLVAGFGRMSWIDLADYAHR
jgi:putative heme iron utilization protein